MKFGTLFIHLKVTKAWWHIGMSSASYTFGMLSIKILEILFCKKKCCNNICHFSFSFSFIGHKRGNCFVLFVKEKIFSFSASVRYIITASGSYFGTACNLSYALSLSVLCFHALSHSVLLEIKKDSFRVLKEN